MPAKNPELTAVQQIVSALQALDATAQDRVLSSVLALLGKSVPITESRRGRQDEREHRVAETEREEIHTRPKGLTELLGEKKPSTNAQRIALFAYYRDKHEDNARFGRDDLKDYFGKARLEPPGNYDRDFSAAVEKGWIHENAEQSYITTSGIEVVEQAFEGEYGRSTRKRNTPRKSARKTSLRKAGRKKRRTAR